MTIWNTYLIITVFIVAVVVPASLVSIYTTITFIRHIQVDFVFPGHSNIVLAFPCFIYKIRHNQRYYQKNIPSHPVSEFQSHIWLRYQGAPIVNIFLLYNKKLKFILLAAKRTFVMTFSIISEVYRDREQRSHS